MARVIDHMPPDGRSRRGRYDWDNWFDGQAWLLVNGEDFTTEIEAFRSLVHTAAKRRGLVVRTVTTPDGNVAIQVVTDHA